MTAVEAIEELNNIQRGDQECAHSTADDILLDFLASNGHKEVAEAWKRAESHVGGFWYA